MRFSELLVLDAKGFGWVDLRRFGFAHSSVSIWFDRQEFVLVDREMSLEVGRVDRTELDRAFARGGARAVRELLEQRCEYDALKVMQLAQVDGRA